MDRIYGSFLMYKEGQAALSFLGRTYGEEKILLLLENFWKEASFSDVFKLTIGKDYKEFDDGVALRAEEAILPAAGRARRPQQGRARRRERRLQRETAWSTTATRSATLFHRQPDRLHGDLPQGPPGDRPPRPTPGGRRGRADGRLRGVPSLPEQDRRVRFPAYSPSSPRAASTTPCTCTTCGKNA